MGIRKYKEMGQQQKIGYEKRIKVCSKDMDFGAVAEFCFVKYLNIFRRLRYI